MLVHLKRYLLGLAMACTALLLSMPSASASSHTGLARFACVCNIDAGNPSGRISPILHAAVPALAAVGPEVMALAGGPAPQAFSKLVLDDPSNPEHCGAHNALLPVFNYLRDNWQSLPVAIRNDFQHAMESRDLPLTLVVQAEGLAGTGNTAAEYTPWLLVMFSLLAAFSLGTRFFGTFRFKLNPAH